MEVNEIKYLIPLANRSFYLILGILKASQIDKKQTTEYMVEVDNNMCAMP